jgi:primosomal protein N' (replication factor Y)
MFAHVVFNRPITPLTYEIQSQNIKAQPGMRVSVKLRQKPAVGIIYKITETTDLKEVKPVEEILDGEPVLNSDLIQLGEWIADYYLCSIGEALWTIVPKGFKKREKSVLKDISFQEDLRGDAITLTEEQTEVFSRLQKSLEEDSQRYFLLHGITGSGKTISEDNTRDTETRPRCHSPRP